MWMKKLQDAVQRMKEGEEVPNRGVQGQDISIFQDMVKRKLNFSLPESYIKVLKIVNGLEYDDFILYGVDRELLTEDVDENVNGFLYNNEIWREDSEEKYIYLGDSHISWYVYDTEMDQYAELDRPSGDVMEIFDSFDALFGKMLIDMLNESYHSDR